MFSGMRGFSMMLIAFMFLLLFSCASGSVYVILYDAEQERVHPAYLGYQNIECGLAGGYLEVDANNPQWLRGMLRLELLRMAVIRENIINAETTRSPDGLPYNRRYVEISSENGIEVKIDPHPEYRIVYDPTHPDAGKDGPTPGYVLYPGFDRAREYEDYIASARLYNSLAEYIQRNNINIVADKVDIQSLEEITSFGKSFIYPDLFRELLLNVLLNK